MTVIGRNSPTSPTIAPTFENRVKTPRARHSWTKPPHIALKQMRVSTPKAPKLPTLDDRMQRFLAKLSNGIADEASTALKELAMMVTAEAIEREVPATEILTPIAAKMIAPWSGNQVDYLRKKLIEHRDSLAGSKTRQGIIEMVVALLDKNDQMEAELNAQFELLKQNLNNDDVDLAKNEDEIYRQSAAFANILDRHGEDRVAPAMIRCFKRILPKLRMRTTVKKLLERAGVAGASIPRQLPTYKDFDGTDWVVKRARILVLLHETFHRAEGSKPPELALSDGYGAICFEFLEDYPKRFTLENPPSQLVGKGKQREF